jgi:hypothetical protein
METAQVPPVHPPPNEGRINETLDDDRILNDPMFVGLLYPFENYRVYSLCDDLSRPAHQTSNRGYRRRIIELLRKFHSVYVEHYVLNPYSGCLIDQPDQPIKSRIFHSKMEEWVLILANPHGGLMALGMSDPQHLERIHFVNNRAWRTL